MQIAVLLNAHSDIEVIKDTIDAVLTYVTDKILLIVDAKYWDEFKFVDLPVNKVCGFYHGIPRAPYRNMALGMHLLRQQWDVPWYCYVEYDVLFTSQRFMKSLELAQSKNVWMLGNCGHVDVVELPFIEELIGEKLRSIYYMLGCCQFFNRDFMLKLEQIDFFEKFLFLTNQFGSDFPKYTGYDISEHLYPTLCRQFGGNIGVFASWDDVKKIWHGASQYFPMRWKPAITETSDLTSIVHPSKTMDDVRLYYREKRQEWKQKMLLG
jgi:hypothetical protein